MSKEDWKKFNIQANEYFNYLMNNFSTMIDGNKVKHLDIFQGLYGLHDYAQDIKKEYYTDIQKELVLWIKNECVENDIFQFSNWRPFRDPELIIYMFYGYYKLFRYKQYYFQLVIEDYFDCDDCEYCKNNDTKIHFSLAMYGWKEDDELLLQPLNFLQISSDNLIPKRYWNDRD